MTTQLPTFVLRRMERELNDALRLPQNRFLSWDGEGVTHEGRADQSYVLLGNSDGDSIDAYQLGTDACLDFILTNAKSKRNVIHISFGFGYDVDMILRDVDDEDIRQLRETNELLWNGYRIRYIPRKMFTLSAKGRGRVTIYDTMTFFTATLVNAAKQYVPDSDLLEYVAAGKAERDSFQWDELYSHIRPYWQAENLLHVELMGALRHAFISAGMKLKHWHGPGAVATQTLEQRKLGTHILQSKSLTPAAVTDASAYAFFGGRFEDKMIGRIPGPIYSYDIRSAYPAALSVMPSATNGRWVRSSDVNEWGIYQTSWNHENLITPWDYGCLPVRSEYGTVSFAISGSGWHYGHEVLAARMSGFPVHVSDGWHYESITKPFTFVQELYLQRAAWKECHNPAQYAAKLALNSLYGKLAQLIGYDEIEKEPPRYHQQWYAGHTTSWCRARILLAMMQRPEDIIAVETDGIYSRSLLDLRIGTQLGEWEGPPDPDCVYDEMIYVQSGLYFLRKGDKWVKVRSRGMGKGKVSYDNIRPYIDGLETFTTTDHRYGGMGAVGTDRRHTWYDQTREVSWGGGGKRYHDPARCHGCDGMSDIHTTVISLPHAGASVARNLPWITGHNGAEWDEVDADANDV